MTGGRTADHQRRHVSRHGNVSYLQTDGHKYSKTHVCLLLVYFVR